MNQYTIYCSEAQTKKAYELGAPIEKNNIGWDEEKHIYIDFILVPPTVEQMCGWLQEQGVKITYDGVGYQIKIEDFGCLTEVSRHFFRNDAIDDALDYVKENKI